MPWLNVFDNNWIIKELNNLHLIIVEDHYVEGGFAEKISLAISKLDTDISAALMSINAVKGVNIGSGMNAAFLSGEENSDEIRKKSGKIKTPKLNVRSFKVYGDGALGSRGAALKKPYCDDPHNYGFLRTDIKDLKYYANEIAGMGFQMNTHAIGDKANRIVLNAYRDALFDFRDPRWRIEHAQVIAKEDFALFNRKIIKLSLPFCRLIALAKRSEPACL